MKYHFKHGNNHEGLQISEKTFHQLAFDLRAGEADSVWEVIYQPTQLTEAVENLAGEPQLLLRQREIRF